MCRIYFHQWRKKLASDYLNIKRCIAYRQWSSTYNAMLGSIKNILESEYSLILKYYFIYFFMNILEYLTILVFSLTHSSIHILGS